MSSITRSSIQLLVEAYGRLGKADIEPEGRPYVIAVPKYESDDRGVENHEIIRQMVVVGDYYYGQGTFLLYESNYLAAQFSYDVVKEMYEQQQELKTVRAAQETKS